MIKRHLQIVAGFLFAACLASCGGTPASMPATSTTATNGPGASRMLASSSRSRGKFATGATYIAINAGGMASSNWTADTGYSGGATTVVTSPINTSNVANPAPQAVYQSARFGTTFSYTVANLTPGGPYTVRLHFVESYFNGPGLRIFGVTINGPPVLTDFDIFETAGGKNTAVARQFLTNADASGMITIRLTASLNNATLAGIEVSSSAGPPTPAPPLAINAGGLANGNWLADTFYNGGRATTSSTPINTSFVANPAPQSVYQTVRWTNQFSYAIPDLIPNGSYTLRLHFVEPYFTAVGKRIFNVVVNGTRAVNNLDIFQAAGGRNIAFVEQVSTTADANGNVSVQFLATVNNAAICGIELIPSIATPTPAPPPFFTFYHSTATAIPKISLNPNPFAVRICASDPCTPRIDPNSGMYNSNWFGSVPYLGHITPAIPGDSTSVAYTSIPIYAGSTVDPTYTFVSNVAYGGPYTGVHVPNGAHADPSGEDFLFDVVDGTTGIETNGFEFNNGNTTIPHYDNGTIGPLDGGMPSPVYMYGGGASIQNCFTGGVNRCFGGSAARTPQSVDELDPVELLQQVIPHKLHIVAGCVSSTFVYPAAGSGGQGPVGCPPMGEFLWLDLSDARIEALPLTRWQKTLYHNLHQYGWTVEDNGLTQTGSANAFSLQIASDYSWTAIGQPSQWALMLAEMQAEGTTLARVGSGPYAYQITLPTAPGVSLSNMHWVQCQGAVAGC